MAVTRDSTKQSVSDLLKLHNKNLRVKYCLKENIGDGFLVQKNIIYRNVRQLAVQAGYRFTTKHFANSRLFPLSSLDDFHKRKLIPFDNNVQVLQGLAKKRPNISIPRWHKLFHFNHLLHESSHAYAHSIFSKLLRKKNEKESFRFLISLLEESFANTAETFSYVFCKDNQHTSIMAMNNYSLGRGLNKKISHHAPKEFLEMSFGMMLMSCLFANYLRQNMTPQEFKEVIRLLKEILKVERNFSPVEIENLKEISKIGQGINISFRIITAEFYLELNGYKSSLIKLVKFNFLGAICKNQTLQMALATLIQTTLADNRNKI